MTTNFLFAQAPNRKGNVSKHTPKGNTGVTAVTRPQGSTTYSSPHQGAAKASGSATAGRGQKVMVSRPEAYDCYAHNTGYLKNSSYLK